MSAPRWAAALLRRLAPPDRVEDVLGDLEEAHARNVERRGRLIGSVVTAAESLEVAVALLRHSPRTRGTTFSWLDFKLGLRMLVRYPGLTVVGGIAIAFAIWVGAAAFEFITQVVHPTLPLPQGDRIVAVRLYDAQTGGLERRTVHDFLAWQEEATTLESWGAFRNSARNLIVGDGPGDPVTLAEMSASGFAVVGVAPLLGRTLSAADEAPGATDVVVIGYDVWRSRFAGDPAVIGRTVGLGAARATVVGVMPEDFGFPIAHRAWIPLRLQPSSHGWRQGPAINVFARLAPGATMREAGVELAELGRRHAAVHPGTHAHLRVDVAPYAWAALDLPPSARNEVAALFLSVNFFLVALLTLICSNVALLIFARAAARESELVVRSALGAGRGRIVAQLFVEALVLGAVGAVIGLAGSRYGLRWGLSVWEGDLPFWFRDRLSPVSVVFAVALTVLGAAIGGVLPALKVTRGLGAQLRQATGGGGGLRFGGIWTAVIVMQVAVTVAFPAVSFLVLRDLNRVKNANADLADERYLVARLDMDREPPPTAPADTSRAAFLARYRTTIEELERRLLADESVVDVTFAERVPRMYHAWHQIEVDQGAVPPPDLRGHRMGVVAVDLDYFDVLGAPILAGRPFGTGDLAADARVVIVNRPFVDSVLGGKNPIGRRLRIVASESSREPDPTAPWHEIVGVVPDLGTTSGYGPEGVYLPARMGDHYPLRIAVHVQGDARAFAPRLMETAMRVDPTLRIEGLIRLDDVIREEMRFYTFWLRLSLGVSAVALLLSLAGIYAVMSFTVSRRTREIGIRVALGCRSSRVVPAILARPLTQIACGIAAGMSLVSFLALAVAGWTISAPQIAVVVGYAALMTGVCLIACIVPTRRALRVEPTEALRADG